MLKNQKDIVIDNDRTYTTAELAELVGISQSAALNAFRKYGYYLKNNRIVYTPGNARNAINEYYKRWRLRGTGFIGRCLRGKVNGGRFNGADIRSRRKPAGSE
jgi:hypothetical protein